MDGRPREELEILWPNHTLEPLTAFGAVNFAVAVHAANRRWLNCFYVRCQSTCHEFPAYHFFCASRHSGGQQYRRGMFSVAPLEIIDFGRTSAVHRFRHRWPD